MTSQGLTDRFTVEGFVRAWEAGAFHERVELVDGEVWPVPIGSWHGDTTMRAARALPDDGVTFTSESLVTEQSVPDADFWVRPNDAVGTGRIGERLTLWRAADVLLVVEVADETAADDLGPKARLYSRCGYRLYWVLTRRGLYAHAQPAPEGYRARTLHRRGESVSVPWSDGRVEVSALLAPDP